MRWVLTKIIINHRFHGIIYCRFSSFFGICTSPNASCFSKNGWTNISYKAPILDILAAAVALISVIRYCLWLEWPSVIASSVWFTRCSFNSDTFWSFKRFLLKFKIFIVKNLTTFLPGLCFEASIVACTFIRLNFVSITKIALLRQFFNNVISNKWAGKTNKRESSKIIIFSKYKFIIFTNHGLGKDGDRLFIGRRAIFHIFIHQFQFVAFLLYSEATSATCFVWCNLTFYWKRIIWAWKRIKHYSVQSREGF